MVYGAPLLLLTIAWAVAAPVAGWLALNYLDANGLDRSENRLIVHGAFVAAMTPPLFTAVRQFSRASLRAPAWYLVLVLAALAAFVPASDSANPASTVKFRRIHAFSAIMLATFAVAHVFNHTLAIVSLQTHTAVLGVLRLVYRERVGETILIAAVAVQVLTGLTMVWKSYLRRANPMRNLQLLSGLYLVSFLIIHVMAAFTARARGTDTNFAWASSAPAGLLGRMNSVAQLPRYSLAIVAVFIHLASQARWNLARFVSSAAARRVSYGVMALGGAAAAVIALAACGVHLAK
jgi:hypothetical protein